jgi:ribosomal protein L7/L12
MLSTRRWPNGAQAKKGTSIMEQEYYRRLIQLEARMHRMEAMMQTLLVRLGIDAEEITPQEPRETGAIREALLSGNKIKAIKLYRELYGVGLKEAKDAVDAMEGGLWG